MRKNLLSLSIAVAAIHMNASAGGASMQAIGRHRRAQDPHPFYSFANDLSRAQWKTETQRHRRNR